MIIVSDNTQRKWICLRRCFRPRLELTGSWSLRSYSRSTIASIGARLLRFQQVHLDLIFKLIRLSFVLVLDLLQLDWHRYAAFSCNLDDLEVLFALAWSRLRFKDRQQSVRRLCRSALTPLEVVLRSLDLRQRLMQHLDYVLNRCRILNQGQGLDFGTARLPLVSSNSRECSASASLSVCEGFYRQERHWASPS